MMEKWKSGKMEEWNFGKPKGKPQRGEILIELMDSIAFGGAAHRNINQYFRCAAPRNSTSLRISTNITRRCR